MQDVTLQVNGQYHSLGSIPSLGTASVRVSPTSQTNPGANSQVAVEFLDKSGQRTRLEVDTYFESSYRGNIDIDVRDGEIMEVRDHAQPLWP